MSKLEILERQIEQLSEEERKHFRAWFAEFDVAAWDEQIEADARSGRLDRLAEQAIREHQSGRSTPL